MKKQEFLREISLGISNKNNDSLKKLVLEFARFIPRDEYEQALIFINKNDVVAVKIKSVDLLKDVKQFCERVTDGSYTLTWDYNEGYYDGYYDDDEALIDRDGLGEEIREFLETAMSYINDKRYSEALATFDMLFSLEIPVEDYDDLTLASLFSHDLINLDESLVLKHYACSVIMSFVGNERTKKLFDVVGLLRYNVKLLEITRLGDADIPNRAQFEEEWVSFLMSRQLHQMHEFILLDAVLFGGGTQGLHDFTLEHGIKYQSAYTYLVNMYIENDRYSEAVSVIMEGFDKLKGVNSIRTKIADMLLGIGNLNGDSSMIKQGVWEGFASSLDLRHYINICNLRDESMKEPAMECMSKHPSKPSDRNYIRFLHGDYDSVYKECVQDTTYLGWSSSEKGKILPLFVALLAGGEVLSACAKKLIDTSFSNSDVKDAFFKLLPESYKQLPRESWTKYFDWCITQTEKRVEAIVKGQHRGSYYKASALIVCIAEVIRQTGDNAGAQRFIISYKEKYPRHSSFRACLLQDIGLAKFGKLF